MLGYAEITKNLPNCKGLFFTCPMFLVNPAVPTVAVFHDVAQVCPISMVIEAGERIIQEKSHTNKYIFLLVLLILHRSR